jgi:hypothetical protein
MIRRRHQHQRVGRVLQHQGRGQDGRCGVAADGLDHHARIRQPGLGRLFQREKPERVAGHHQGRAETFGGEPAKRHLIQALPAQKGRELLRICFAGHRPEPGAGAAAQDDGMDQGFTPAAFSGANEHVSHGKINAAPVRHWHDIIGPPQVRCPNPAPEMCSVRHPIPVAMTITPAFSETWGEGRGSACAKGRHPCIFTQTPLAGAYVVDLEKRGDDRGYFARAFCAREFAEQGLATHFVQANMSLKPRYRDAARAALSVCPRHRKPSLCAVSPGRFTTSSSISAPTVPPTCKASASN